MPAPENYVAGLGRGATGFTTRSDLGPAREGPSEEQLKEALAKRAKQLELGTPTAYGVTEKKEDEEEDEERFRDPDDEQGLFASGLYDKDDDEADRIYQAVDERMERRRRAQRLVHIAPTPSLFSSSSAQRLSFEQHTDMRRREAREQREREEYEAKNPKISQQFADAKRALSTISEDEWANLPEVGDLTGRNKRARTSRMQRFYAVPDSVLAAARDAGQMDTSIDAGEDGAANGSNGVNGDAADGTVTNFAQIGAAREKQLSLRLEQAEKAGSESTNGTSTSIDPKGYLTSLATSEMKATELNLGDISRTRLLLESVTNSNPTHAPGWISAARLEEHAGKHGAARSKIMQGCQRCPKSEDVWLEAIRLHMEGNNRNAKVIAADAIKENPRSIKLWLAASELESESNARKKVLRKAIDNNPKSVQLWKAAANLEEPKDAMLMLAKATQFVPSSVDLWLAYARLCTKEQAEQVLNQARRAIPTSHEIWVAATRLQEQGGNADLARKVMNRGIKTLAKESAMLKREEWIAEAEKAEIEGAVVTCQAIIENTLGWDLDEDDDRKDIWMDDAKESETRGRYHTARAIYAYALRVFATKASVWKAAAELERRSGSENSLLNLLEKAVEACPKSDDLWLQLAREKWQNGDIDGARVVLGRAFKQNASESIWLAAVKLEADAGFSDKAKALLAQARQAASTDRIWYKSVAFERQLGHDDDALDLANQALQIFPANAKLWMQKGQVYEAKANIPKAREAYNAGTRAVPKSPSLWILAARLEEKNGVLVKARSILDRARLALPKSDVVWTESVRLERRNNNVNAAQNLMSKALQELPKSGLLWTERIMHLETRTARKSRALEAAKLVGDDKFLFTTISRIFWAERKLDKAVTWFEKAILVDPDWGDSWAWYYKFLSQHGTDEKKEEVLRQCVKAEPKHGEVWQRIAKDPKNTTMKPQDVLLQAVKEVENV
jgi:pre-mRNA-processing factor 6